MFVELVFAPGYDEDALEVLEQKPNMRLLEDQERRDRCRSPSTTSSACAAGCSCRTATRAWSCASEMQVVTERKPSEEEWGELLFAMRGVQARALERDRARARTSARSGSARAR